MTLLLRNLGTAFIWAGASRVGRLLMTLVLLLVLKDARPASQDAPASAEPARCLATPKEIAQLTPNAEVGEEALRDVQEDHRVVLPTVLSSGRPMPSRHFPGQRRPPCVRGETEIHGACWLGPMGGQEPPCGNQMFDYKGKCYFASFDQSPQPTSSFSGQEG